MSDTHMNESTHTTQNPTTEKSDVARREEEMLTLWRERDIFNKSVAKDAPLGEFTFYDGPPFATGLPHYGHLLAGTIKDTIPRYQTMRGFRVRRRWGWDCHGLPLENLIEEKLGLATKRDIETFGIKKFNEAARGAVLEYADDWRKIVPRMGRFVDMEDDYKTMDATYTESVWWVFSQLHKKGLVYEGFKSMHLCPRCGTTLSNFEVNQGYKDIKDIAVTVKLPLLDDAGQQTGTSLLVWTTTPWTLPGNMAAAIGREHDYAVVALESGEKVVLAKARLAQLGDMSYTLVSEIKGSELEGKSYLPPFAYFKERDFKGKENAWKIWHADYVELGQEGTGAVHIAPAYGEDDMNLAKAQSIPIVHHVDRDGRFMDFITDYAGYIVKPKDDDDTEVSHLDTDIEIVRALNLSGRLLKKENITHSYPHCWRCKTPLLNYGTTSWFVEVTKIKDQLVAANNTVGWVPDHVGTGRFGKWLEGARDWAVSRQRYWGAPLPIWRNPGTKEFKVFGSYEELARHIPTAGNTYFLMRHGEAEANTQDRVSTKIDEVNPLTERGREAAARGGAALREQKIDLIIASPFQRTRETAEIAAAQLGIAPDAIVYDERLGEIQTGVFDGKSRAEYHGFLESSASWYTAKPEGGESHKELRMRVGAFLQDIDARYAGKRILVVTHNSPLNVLRAMTHERGEIPEVFDHHKEGRTFPHAEALEAAFVRYPHNDEYVLDFHRPYIDDVEVRDEHGTKLERVPDVFDCWFESGSMPYGQNHYPFANTDVFEPNDGRGFPAQFIAEGVDQTRGWFYSLMVLGVALFGKSPYEHVVVNGLVLAEDGRKMSKSLRNYPDPMELVNTLGADSMRLYLLTSPVVRGEDLNFSEKGVLELQRKTIGRLHNVLQMYEMYKDDAVVASEASTHVLDRWMIASLHNAVRTVTEGFNAYELDKASRPILDVIDDVSVWYLRRSRDRLKSDDRADAQAALATLRYTLKTLSLSMAPVMPFYAEYLWQAVRAGSDAESVHLADWPYVEDIDAEVLEMMRATREVVTKALEARTKAGIKVRQPIATMKIHVPLASEYQALVIDEVNVKEVVVDTDHQGVWIDTEITPELKREGEMRDLVRAIQDARKDAGFVPSDRIVLTISAAAAATLQGFEADVQKTVGADTIRIGDTGDAPFTVAKI